MLVFLKIGIHKKKVVLKDLFRLQSSKNNRISTLLPMVLSLNLHCKLPKKNDGRFSFVIVFTKLFIILGFYHVSSKTFHPLHINFNPFLSQKIYYLWKIFKTNTIQIITPRTLCLGGSYFHERN